MEKGAEVCIRAARLKTVKMRETGKRGRVKGRGGEGKLVDTRRGEAGGGGSV